MKIFVIPGAYPNKYEHGHGSFVFEQCVALKRYGHELTVLDATAYNYLRWNDMDCKRIAVTKDEVGTVYTLHTRGIMSSRFPCLATRSYSRCLSALFTKALRESGKPDMLLAHFSFPAGYVASYLADEYCLPLVIVEHHTLFLQKKLSYYLRKVLIRSVESANKFVCVSTGLKSAIERALAQPKDIVVVPNYIDQSFAFCKPKEAGGFVFFCAGLLINRKRMDVLIAAFCMAFSEADEVELRIAGSGKESARLQSLIEENHRERQIHMLGHLSKDEMKLEYQKCHCFVLLSQIETFGIVYREAMATGRPVISSDNLGINENWNNSYGIITNDNTVAAARDAMIQMRENYSNYDGRQISIDCLCMYGESSTMLKMNHLLESVMDDNRE